MRKIFSRIFMFVLPVMLISCEEFLEEEPKDRLVSENFFLTTGDIEIAMHTVYGEASYTFSRAHIIAVTLGSDELLSTDNLGNKADFQELDLFMRNGSNTRRFRRVWNGCYSGIKQSHFVMENVDKANVPQEVTDLTKGQCHFIRALSYFWLTRLWGHVPLVTSSDYAQEVKMGTPEEIYDLILSDLEIAERSLPYANWSSPDINSETMEAIPELWQNNRALPTQGTVRSLRALVYLTMAGLPLEKGTEYYNKAAEEAKYVIDRASDFGYRLLDDYQDLWLIDNNFHEEGILTFGYHPDGYDNDLSLSLRPIDEAFGSTAKGWNDAMVEQPFFLKFPEGYRKEVTFLTGWYTGKSGMESTWTTWDSSNRLYDNGRSDYSYKCPYIAKWRSNDGFPYDSTWNFQTKPGYRAVSVFRYAHVLLTYAEARARADGSPDAEAYEAINMIRRRANKLPVHLPSSADLSPGLSGIQFADSVIAEKGWEFIGEPESRWFDLVRLNKVESTLSEIIAYRTKMRSNGELHKSILIPGDRSPVPSEIRKLNWLNYPAEEVILNPELFEGYYY